MADPLTALFVAIAIALVAALLFWPQRGYYWQTQRVRRQGGRVLLEDALKHLYNFEYRNQPASVESLGGALEVSRNEAADLLVRAEERGLVKSESGVIHLTPIGRSYALRIIRVHRLWEHYLSEETGVTEEDWHRLAEEREHDLADDDVDQLAFEMGNPAYDPHGDPIPTADGEIAPQRGVPLSEAEVGSPVTVVHVEDEPEAVYAQIVAEGLQPGVRLDLIELTPERVRFWANGTECILAPIIAANVAVVVAPGPIEEEEEEFQDTLAVLRPGESGEVIRISRRCRGLARRRLMDLGILPGTAIHAEMKSPSGDPTAYRIRGATVALRREQADHIQINRTLEAH